MGREMIRWHITEKVTNIFGETNEYHVGWVDATTEQAALNKARKKFKWDRDGIPNRKRNSDNFYAWAVLMRR